MVQPVICAQKEKLFAGRQVKQQGYRACDLVKAMRGHVSQLTLSALLSVLPTKCHSFFQSLSEE